MDDNIILTGIIVFTVSNGLILQNPQWYMLLITPWAALQVYLILECTDRAHKLIAQWWEKKC